MAEHEEVRAKVAQACRILAMTGLVKEITGHVSARVPGSDGEMYLRCRGDDEFGLPYTGAVAIQRVTLDGDSEVAPGNVLPIELPIHGEVLRAKPEMNCVVHAHPPYCLLCGMAGIELRPVYGAYDPSGITIATQLKTYPRSILISSRELGEEVVRTMGDSSFALLRGHGIVVAGATIEEATINAIRLENLAKTCWQLAQHGPLPEISAADIEAFGGPTNPRVARGAEWVWRYYARLEESWTPTVVG
ncbi:MAG TPA: class II aldolase/adducin family protein [Chloroflexota bacterium]|nr:class II aldolase/adducin family protein [Chloroflexota bacterium]